MKLAAALLLVAAGCGGAQAATERSAQATAPVCETLLDAGTACDPCPGSPKQSQIDHICPDAGPAQTRLCDCPLLPDGGLPNRNTAGIQWPACPPLNSDLLDAGWIQPTCANVLAQYQRDCLP